jgi:hypothetical protein
MPAATACIRPGKQKIAHLADDIAVRRRFLHIRRLALHVHEAHADIARRAHLDAPWSRSTPTHR